MFIETIATDPIRYVSIVVVVLFSIILHELGHAYAALWQGDTTARDEGHLNLDPLTHMDPIAIGALLVAGISWGSCPVDPSAFRDGRKGELLVAAAGPATNAVLGVLFVGALVLWGHFGPAADAGMYVERIDQLLFVGGVMNFALALFNLLPIPPLDGFTVAKSSSAAFREFAPTLERHALLLFLVVFLAAPETLFAWARTGVGLVAGAFGAVLA